MIVQDVIEGNIIQMASRVVDTLRTKYLLSPIHYEGLQRVEQLEVPERRCESWYITPSLIRTMLVLLSKCVSMIAALNFGITAYCLKN